MGAGTIDVEPLAETGRSKETAAVEANSSLSTISMRD